MDFPITGEVINPLLLAGIECMAGVRGGFFGVVAGSWPGSLPFFARLKSLYPQITTGWDPT